MKTTYFLLTLTLMILGSAAKAQYIPGNNGIITNYSGGKGAYPSDAFRQKAKLAATVPQKNIHTPKPQSLTKGVIKKSILSHPSMINGYTLVLGEDQGVYCVR
ncbi:hypothetical protein [Haliscomenobacter hydrossis]|uniref:Uncharacterized protein n=1 Tax=Haliscomenobacter hydrossis (strain ATCC 27775 / DSM 1100 / LMG 10767 / O) TaxID=760192 RepID=F4KUJ1_HALH1|nr:hypothetical protein [Haliscomenobacter hydrossis]AEE52427.1 hypothetical protein Halhy_4588 [Haliscomenobacter hydrossis DSM 1100]